MTVQHHIDDATLLRYVSGDLDEAFCVVVASHLAMCDTCRQAARAMEQVGGHLLDSVGEETLAGDAFDILMKKLDAGGDQINVSARDVASAPPEGDVPLPLRRFVGNNLNDIAWRTVAPGVRKRTIDIGSGSSKLYMLHIGSGKSVPEHGHGGAEMTLVLKGAYNDMFGRFGPGDIADLDEHVEHQPIVEDGEACICVVASEAPTRFKDLVSRLIQPLVGI